MSRVGWGWCWSAAADKIPLAIQQKSPLIPLVRGSLPNWSSTLGIRNTDYFPKDFPSQFNSWASIDATPPYQGGKGDLLR